MPAPAESRHVESGERIGPQLTFGDYIVMGLSSGRALLAVPFAFGAVQQVLAFAGMERDPLGLIRAVGIQLDDAVVVLGIIGFVAFGVGYGALLSWLRFRGYRVVLDERVLSFTAGLFRREVRAVQLDDVVALVCRPGWVLASLRKVRVRGLTAGDAAGLTRGMLIPVSDVDTARTATRHLLEGLEFPRTVNAFWSRVCVAIFVASAVLTGLGFRAHPRGFLVATALIGALTCVRIAAEVGGDLRLHAAPDGRWIVIHRGALPGTDWAARCSVIDRVSWHRCGIGRRSIDWVTVSFRGTRSRRIRIRCRGIRTFAEVRSAVASPLVSIASQEKGKQWDLLN